MGLYDSKTHVKIQHGVGCVNTRPGSLQRRYRNPIGLKNKHLSHHLLQLFQDSVREGGRRQQQIWKLLDRGSRVERPEHFGLVDAPEAAVLRPQRRLRAVRPGHVVEQGWPSAFCLVRRSFCFVLMFAETMCERNDSLAVINGRPFNCWNSSSKL